MSRALRAFCGSSAELYAEALARHRRVLRDAFVAEGGVEVDTQGDAFFIAFPTAACAGHAVPLVPHLPGRIQAWREVNELPDRELMRDGRWLV